MPLNNSYKESGYFEEIIKIKSSNNHYGIFELTVLDYVNRKIDKIFIAYYILSKRIGLSCSTQKNNTNITLQLHYEISNDSDVLILRINFAKYYFSNIILEHISLLNCEVISHENNFFKNMPLPEEGVIL